MVNSGPQNAVARAVYSSLARARSTPSVRIRAWSKASGPGRRSIGAQLASAASVPATGVGRPGASAGVPAGCAVAGELLEVDGASGEPGLFGQLARRGGVEVFVRAKEAAGQRPPPFVRFGAAADQQHTQVGAADGQHDEVDGHG